MSAQHSRPRRAMRVLARVVGVIAAVAPFSSCYVLSQGASLIRYQAAAEPIDEILRRGTLSDGSPLASGTRAFLDEVEEVRSFADSIGLASSRNYTTLVATERNYLADVVNATGELSFERHEWWWPFVGRLPYKGYYEREDAVRLAERLRKRGLDVWVRHVDAFSTLGVFRDPLYEFMSTYDTLTIANLILHEQTHATIFLRGHAQFNEELATFVGDTAARNYVLSAGGDEELRLADDRVADQETVRRLILDLRDDLQNVYASTVDDQEKRAEKERIISAFQERVRTGYEALFRTDAYGGLAEIPINNAFIDLYVAYTEDLELFRNLYDACGEDLRIFLEVLDPLQSPREIEDASLRRLARRDPKLYISDVLLDSSAGGSVE